MKFDNTNFYHWIKECNQYDLSQFVPFVVAGKAIGYVHKNKLDWLTAYGEIELSNNQLAFSKSITGFDQRTEVINGIAEDLYHQKKITSWVDEQYDVAHSFGDEVLFTIERAAATLFGIQKYGVHVNGYTIKHGEYYLWVAKRAMDKPTWPGKLDHLVAGGHASAMSIQTTLEKECQEEAGMNEQLSKQAIPVGLVDYNLQIGEKLSRDVLFNYDVKLTENFVPVNTDGEVEEFFLWPLEKVLQIVNKTRDFKTNCNLVIIDFAVRHGFIHPDEDLYTQIVNGLRYNPLT
ncbi:MAG: DUF4743 domain-containing protein [Pseudomonadota bacterium]